MNCNVGMSIVREFMLYFDRGFRYSAFDVAAYLYVRVIDGHSCLAVMVFTVIWSCLERGISLDFKKNICTIFCVYLNIYSERHDQVSNFSVC